MRWRSLIIFLIFCWATVIIGGMTSNSTGIIGEEYVKVRSFIAETGFIIENGIFTHHISKLESILPDVRVEYNVQPAFASPKLVCFTSLTSFFLQEYPDIFPDKAAPEPRGPL